MLAVYLRKSGLLYPWFINKKKSGSCFFAPRSLCKSFFTNFTTQNLRCPTHSLSSQFILYQVFALTHLGRTRVPALLGGQVPTVGRTSTSVMVTPARMERHVWTGRVTSAVTVPARGTRATPVR